MKDGDPLGKRIVIVDDLVQSGGTLFECAKKLQAEHAESVRSGAAPRARGSARSPSKALTLERDASNLTDQF